MKQNLEIAKGLLQKRHSEYSLSPEWVQPMNEVETLLGDILHSVPSHFNSQPVRMVLLSGEAHKKHWLMIEEALIKLIGEEAYNKNTKEKVHNSFMSGVATILFFDDTAVTNDLSEKFPLYAPNFPIWAQQVQGSHQLAVWTGLTGLGFGANLQHYTGMIDEKIKAEFEIPEAWTLIAQMPFGKTMTPAEGKDKLPLNKTLLVRK